MYVQSRMSTTPVQAAKLAFLIGNVLAVLISHTGRHLSAIGNAQVCSIFYGFISGNCDEPLSFAV